MSTPVRPVKQVIVIRKDLKMRRGKEITQGAHAAMIWLSDRLVCRFPDQDPQDWPPVFYGAAPRLTEAEQTWLLGSFRKITVRVNSLEELMKVQQAADDAGVMNRLVYDAGLTEFHGIETATALAIGPDYDELIDPVTRDLELY
jgi:peptidyl-tRNA hydrolase, PTH2 family